MKRLLLTRIAVKRLRLAVSNVKPDIRKLAGRGLLFLQRQRARAERRFTSIEFAIRRQSRRYRRLIGPAVIVVLIGGSVVVALMLQNTIAQYFNAERFAALRNLLATTGGALIGATAIGFSVVMIAVQLNFARMPQGLFRKLSSDLRLLGAFAATFLLAIGVAALSLVPDNSWSAGVLIGAIWATLLILIMFFYGYRRALTLINPGVQLGLIVAEARSDLGRWTRRARRMAPLVDAQNDGAERPSGFDLPRLAFFQANPQ
jgi:uncharacterized membrane protein